MDNKLLVSTEIENVLQTHTKMAVQYDNTRETDIKLMLLYFTSR